MDENNSSNGMVMPVAPMGYGYGGYPMMGGWNNGFGGFGGDGGWLVLLLLLAFAGGGFGMGGFGGFGGGLGFDFPWLLNGQNSINNNVNDGFRDAQLHDSVTSVRDGVSNLATQLCGCCGDMQMSIANSTAALQNSLCNGFAGTTAAVTGAQNAISNQLYSNEIASLNRSFAEQTANTQGFNGVQSTLCDIRYGNATNTRDIIDSQTRGTQAILDKLCQLELDTVKTQLAQAQRDNVGLQNQLNMANLATSQTAQTAQILAGQTAEVDALYNRLNSCPVPTTPVYGRTPIFTCNNGCGCSGNTGFVG